VRISTIRHDQAHIRRVLPQDAGRWGPLHPDLSLGIELLSVVVQSLEQVGHLRKRFEHGLLMVGGARAHGIDRHALLGPQRAAVEDRRRQTRNDAPGVARPVE
jgi:hypothetical protein